MNKLFYGDNLDILRDRRKIKDESVDLCYIDPPFNSKRNYNQIYNNVGGEDRAQAQIFIDTWKWDDFAIRGFDEILANDGRFSPALVELIKGLQPVLGDGSLFAYLVSMALRITEIQRVLKPTGSFFLHCDPTASHYLKLLLDAIFVTQGGDFINEIVWCYSQGGKSKAHFGKKHDVIFWYSKSSEYVFNANAVRLPLTPHKQDASGKNYGGRMGFDEDGREYTEKWGTGKKKLYRYYLDEGKIPEDWWTDINSIQADADERQGYPTQKPEALLERIIKATTDEGDIVLDAYCGCGTTVVVAQKLKRQWIGIDITYASISVVLRRLEPIGADVLKNIITDGIPRDIESAKALANKIDDRLRKEFEKWAVLAYTNNRARINDKKGADAGVDGVAYFLTSKNENAKIIFQVKSGIVQRGDIAKLRGDMKREKAALAVLITLEAPSRNMVSEAKTDGHYKHEVMGRNYDVISIVTAQEIVDGKRLDIPMAVDVLKAAQIAASPEEQMELL
jgi:site-specific DNA-methyltransferase (adenine-specific)